MYNILPKIIDRKIYKNNALKTICDGARNSVLGSRCSGLGARFLTKISQYVIPKGSMQLLDKNLPACHPALHRRARRDLCSCLTKIPQFVIPPSTGGQEGIYAVVAMINAGSEPRVPSTENRVPSPEFTQSVV